MKSLLVMNVYFQNTSKPLCYTVNSGYVIGQTLLSHCTFKRGWQEVFFTQQWLWLFIDY